MKQRVLSIVLLMLLMFTSLSFASEKVIGKLFLKAGADVFVIISSPQGGFLPMGATAFEDQTFYIIEKWENERGSGYRAKASGFVHNCQAHGREVFDGEGVFVVIIDSQIDGDLIKVELFKE